MIKQPSYHTIINSHLQEYPTSVRFVADQLMELSMSINSSDTLAQKLHTIVAEAIEISEGKEG